MNFFSLNVFVTYSLCTMQEAVLDTQYWTGEGHRQILIYRCRILLCLRNVLRVTEPRTDDRGRMVVM
jgi:hypothetical protein